MTSFLTTDPSINCCHNRDSGVFQSKSFHLCGALNSNILSSSIEPSDNVSSEEAASSISVLSSLWTDALSTVRLQTIRAKHRQFLNYRSASMYGAHFLDLWNSKKKVGPNRTSFTRDTIN
jgi:hypothetical protein